jgi:hypothetical protein
VIILSLPQRKDNTMRRFLLIGFLLLMAVSLFAQIPIDFQGSYTSKELIDGTPLAHQVNLSVTADTIFLNGKPAKVLGAKQLDDESFAVILNNGFGFLYLPKDEALVVYDLQSKEILFILHIVRVGQPDGGT